MQDFPAFLRWLNAHGYAPDLGNFEDFEERKWALWLKRLREYMPADSVCLVRVEKAVADVRARLLKQAEVDKARRAALREAKREAALREEEVQRADTKAVDTFKEQCVHMFNGLQKLVGREEVLPRQGGVLSGEGKWAMWIEVMRKCFPEADDFRVQLEQFLEEAKARFPAAAKRTFSSMPVAVVSLATPEEVNVSVEAVGDV